MASAVTRSASDRPDLRAVLAERVVVADGAMGTMLQGYDLSLDEFQGFEGCNEILNITRPDVVREIHQAYFDVGVDCVETNTFGANFANLGEYGIADIAVRTPLHIHNLDTLGLPFLLLVFAVLGVGVMSFVSATQAWRRRLVAAGPATLKP